ncbi:MAG: carbon storage regulator CsrA [Candidatus Melainabacteria bacterium]
MLVLTRKTGQKLMIGDNVVVTILETRGESVKLGIDAPKSVAIHREEIFDEIRKSNQQATGVATAQDLDQAMSVLDGRQLRKLD